MREVRSQIDGVRLGKLLPTATILGAAEINATSCTCDARAVLPGDVFAAVVTADADGHDRIREAIARGAKAILCERLAAATGVPQCLATDSRHAYARLCQALAGDPSQRVKVIGVTGTYGKTTTACLIAAVLEAADVRVSIMGSFGYSDGLETDIAEETTPDAAVLAKWLARSEAAGCSHAVMEISSTALAQRRLAGVELDVACITNIRRDHLDFHGSLVNYRNAKARILRHLSADGFTVLNADDPSSVGLLADLHGPALTVGLKTCGEITATVVERHRSEQTFLLQIGNETAPVRTPLIGDHNIYNCLQAAAIGAASGFSITTICRGLESVQRVPGRLDRIECGQPFGVFVDDARSGDALAGVLKALRQVTTGRVICVFGAPGDDDRQKRPALARAAEAGADVAVLTTDSPRSEDAAEIAKDVMAGFERPQRAFRIADRAEAIAWALETATAGDAVLVAGRGNQTEQIFGRKRLDFDDRQFARQYLYELAGTASASARAG
jgi:UDP-N-acetylmuramoyl-L-alanyl-D-glutamate--2,6-diaminopimelate ligase